ncbi:MAG: UDP-N-acetylglucosamine--N-acetylmuramyl-(pentapeptide) pyrophosphoryl-undecaprenol N-acetylglucosamine transferase [Clostridia bacterium]|nr:UDP-N-acetylglucosamine--N-acetylmuramyl-(pentapeptide) pyrophosphoryl-undecaprenol N-acetylglucosamine transferase [Clostridia bacterium]
MKILLTGGGTAGHVNPALAIAETVKRNLPTAEVLFCGTEGGMERRLVAEAGYPYYPIEVMGLSRSLSPKNIRALYLALTSPHKAKRLLRQLTPDLVVGTGGYVSWPVLAAAASLGIPTALHESNAVPGLTVKRLSGRVDLLMLNFPEAERNLKKAKRTVHVGNPLRQGFASLTREEARRRLGIPEAARLTVSFGGSLGAMALNTAILELFEHYTLKHPEEYHIHGCGSRYYPHVMANIRERFGALPERIGVLEYLKEMPTLMAAADLLICRSGAMTVTEVALSHRASILIPSPNVAGDHQKKNAEALSSLGAALLLPEEELNGLSLTAAVGSILGNTEKRKAMERAAAGFGVPDANRRILRELLQLIEKKKSGAT